MQVIIIDSVEALAIQIERELIKHSCDTPVVDSIISCLHPIEISSESAMEVVKKIRKFETNPPLHNRKDKGINLSRRYFTLSPAEAAGMIESYGRRVPRAMLEEIVRYTTAMMDWDGDVSDYKFVDEFAAKYGVEVEG